MRNWSSPDHFERCKVLYRDGLSMSQIAAVLKREFPGTTFSRCGVIGKLDRALPDRERLQRPAAPAKASKAPGPNRPRIIIAGKNQVRVANSPPPPRPEAVAALRAMERHQEGPGLATIHTLGAHMCRWPIGDPQSNDFTFCGQRQKPGGSYCADHAARAYAPPKPNQPKNGRELARSLRRHLG